MNWEREVAIAGYEGEFSLLALRMLMLILLHRQDVLDYIMEKAGTAGYHRAYYARHKAKRQAEIKRNIRKKYGMSMEEYSAMYRRENRDRIREQARMAKKKAKERKKLERMWE